MLSKEEKQQILEFVTMHLATQGVPGYDSEAMLCRYLTEGGLRCGIGSMLSEQQCHMYDAVDDVGVCISFIAANHVNGWGAEDASFLKDVQWAHDDAANKDPDSGFIEFLDVNLRRVARYWDLRFPEELL